MRAGKKAARKCERAEAICMEDPIYFYIPKRIDRCGWPQRVDEDWKAFGGGANIWTYYTCVALREQGFNCRLVDELPESGIVCSHSRYLRELKSVPPGVFLVCLRADYGRCHLARMHVVQNPGQVKLRGMEILEWPFAPGPSCFIPYWPQPGLIPRDPARGDLFQNIVYYGKSKNLHPSFTTESWRGQVAALGMTFSIVEERPLWHDYSAADAVLAVRPPGRKGEERRKPPSKLTNAWLAGIIPLMGPDSGFRLLREDPLDYLEIRDAPSALAALGRLKEDKDLREKILARGRLRALEFSHAATLRRWIQFFQTRAIPAYETWKSRNPLSRAALFSLRKLRASIKPAKFGG